MNRKRLRELVYQKYDGHCAYCGREIAMKDMQVDHIISRYKNGTDDLENFNPACRMCNFRKGVYTIEQFRREIQDQAETVMKTFGNRMSAVYGLINYTPHEITFYFERHNVHKDKE
jgi:5-methylcytosine-specific restriction endonuclease McrA